METATRLGKYSLKRKLATGGMAEIWLAEQQGPAGFAKTLVIKRILPHLADDSKFVEMFLDEARLAAKLEHPNIVRISDLGLADGSYFIAMEFIDGPDLDYIVERAAQLGTRVPLPIAARIMADSLAGLEFAHTFVDEQGAPMNLVHRDISPHNILVNKAGVAKIVDFGVAKAASSTHKTQTGAIKGKFAYMSPEQIANNPLDGRSDVFAMGIVLYELTTNKRPFGEEGDLMAVTAILTKPPINPRELVTGFPPEMEQIIMKALAKNRDQRYPSAKAMQQDLEKFIFSTGSFVGQSDVAGYLKDLFSDSPSMLGGQKAPELPPRFDGGDPYIPSFSTGSGQQAQPPGPHTPTPNISTGNQPAVSSGHQPAVSSGHQPAVSTGHQDISPPPDTGGGSSRTIFLALGVVGLLAFIVLTVGLAAIFLGGDDGEEGGDGKPETTAETDETDGKDGKDGKGAKNGKDEKDPEHDKPKKATLIVQSVLPADVFFKGEKVCEINQPCRITEKKAGDYTIELANKKGNVRKKFKVKLKAGDVTEKTISSGSLKLNITPESSDYFVKIDHHENPEILKGPVDLFVGSYDVLVRNRKTGKYDEKEVKIKAGKESVVKFKIE
ncbi:MAG: hypothetical protein CMH57_06900 [Myxococcales bacterium]|nr:hypothetical protein [Myxococcales bacterium]